MGILETLAEELGISYLTAQSTASLIEEGNTVAFISRYRKELTGGMDDEGIRAFDDKYSYLKSLEARKKEVSDLIMAQGNLTPELEAKIAAAMQIKEVDDLYLPFRPKKRTRATIAREKGLESLAEAIFSQELDEASLIALADSYLDIENGAASASEALDGACDIIAERISENADYRKSIRNITYRNSAIQTSLAKNAPSGSSEFSMYDGFSEPVMGMAGHRVLAINRGEKKKILKVSLTPPVEQIIDYLRGRIIKGNASDFLSRAINDSYKRLIMPSIENETRSALTKEAEEGAIKVFSKNLKSLLMAPPVKGKRILGFDPGYKNGCKLAAISEVGSVLGSGVIYLERKSAASELIDFIEKYEIDIVAIGNGTASRESEQLVSEAVKLLDRNVDYIIVNEAGASVYSASKTAAQEYADLDVLARGAISIAQRLKDPLAELVKIEPKSIGVGQYQHDVSQPDLEKALYSVVEDAVNTVGIDVNTASAALLSYVSGLTKPTAANINSYVRENGGISSREELKKVSGIGEKTFKQCAGFLRVPESENILDNTAVHPESYEAASSLLALYGLSLDDIQMAQRESELQNIDIEEAAMQLGVGEYTLHDIIEELKKPGRDPRDSLSYARFSRSLMEIDDLEPGMLLEGAVRNVTNFGAFVDIGVHTDGLVHISQLSDRYVSDPFSVVSVGDIVQVKVIGVDLERKRISLSMKSLP
ncbi:MAG: RNA-binding transcriptional accessory protein [Eubacteriaceae bacterium]|nr:RNA-binding transcriptional accessory protein [Eubacteriaceae bacterium]